MACRHSRLVGSPDLERWTMEAGKAVAGAFRQHVVAPLVTIRNDLFATLRTRPSIVSMQVRRCIGQGCIEFVSSQRLGRCRACQGRTGLHWACECQESGAPLVQSSLLTIPITTWHDTLRDSGSIQAPNVHRQRAAAGF